MVRPFLGAYLCAQEQMGVPAFYIFTSHEHARITRAKKGRYSRYFCTKQPVCQTVTGSYSPHFGATLVATVVMLTYTAAVCINTAAVWKNTAAV